MKIHSPLPILGALCSTSTWAVDPSAWTCEPCPYPKGLSGTVEIGADLSSSRSRSDLDVQTVMTEPGFPRASTSLDRIKLYATRKIDDKISLTEIRWQQKYKAVDWRTGGPMPASLGNLLTLGAPNAA